MRYNGKVVYVPGKQLTVADTLPRNPLPKLEVDTVDLTEDVEALEDATQAAWPMSQTKLEVVREMTQGDAELQSVIHHVKNGWPRYPGQVVDNIKPFYSARDALSTLGKLLLYGNRIVIPLSLRSDILERLHDGHQGIVKCRERAKMSVWWPGIRKQIQKRVETCKECQVTKPSQRKEPLITTPLPSRPWEKIAADICEVNKKNYLVVVDYFSRYLEIAHLPDMSSKTVC
ncbi:hypothetical protein DPEC_G00090380 [Dallia pectoralis]|uniref:Uncharacterized protein n=1 Tax=Dallia pectoralis TaxID=75939 RepID=A0ACC2H0L5_DALPE|nr:hypothetical protein DPEC_G00090380 [Dallia pectoralis]